MYQLPRRATPCATPTPLETDTAHATQDILYKLPSQNGEPDCSSLSIESLMPKSAKPTRN